jgi:hypothetical protein
MKGFRLGNMKNLVVAKRGGNKQNKNRNAFIYCTNSLQNFNEPFLNGDF